MVKVVMFNFKIFFIVYERDQKNILTPQLMKTKNTLNINTI